MTEANNYKGFTLIEVMIAFAIVIAVGAIISMSLLDRASTAKIRSDIQSTRVLRSALELYEAELQLPALTKTDAARDLGYLIEKGYIKNTIIKPQSGGSWIYNGNKLFLVIEDEGVKKAISGLTDEEKSYINP